VNRRNFNPGQARRSGGFTLLELLLAFMVFALSFATVLEILSGSMRNTVRARHFTEAALTAQSIMDQVGVVIPLQPGERVNGDSGDYRWDLEIYEYQGGESEMSPVELAELTGIALLQVDLYVSWGSPPAQQVRRFSTVKALLANSLEVSE
jgi:general secretion pathway protein I